MALKSNLPLIKLLWYELWIGHNEVSFEDDHVALCVGDW